MKKLQDAGSKDDIKVPLRVLRDEIGRVFFSGYVTSLHRLLQLSWHFYPVIQDCRWSTIGNANYCKPDMQLTGRVQIIAEWVTRRQRILKRCSNCMICWRKTARILLRVVAPSLPRRKLLPHSCLMSYATDLFAWCGTHMLSSPTSRTCMSHLLDMQAAIFTTSKQGMHPHEAVAVD